MDISLKKIITEMTKVEKEYFIKFSKLFKDTSSTHYLSLYEEINKDGCININNKIISNYYSVEKERLFEKILLSMVNYNLNSSNIWKIFKNILFIQILIKKGLFEKAEKTIKFAKKSAYDCEEFGLISHLLDLETSLCFKRGFICDYSKLNSIQKEREEIYKKIEVLNQLIILKAQIQKFQFDENSYTSDLSYFSEIFGHNPFYPEEKVNSIKSKSICLYINAACFYIQHNYNSAYLTVKQHYKLFRDNPKLFTRDEYLQLMNNFLLCCSLTKKEKLFHFLMNELLNLKGQNKEETFYIKKIKYYRTLALYHYTEKYSEAESLAAEAENFIENTKYNTINIDFKVLHFNIIRAFIENKNYASAINSSNKHYKVVGYEYDSAIFKIFELIAHYKLNNFDYLLYSINSWVKTIQTKRNQFPIEKLIIKFFRTMCNTTSMKTKRTLISSTLAKINELEKSEKKYYINHLFDFTAWFERELEEID